MKNVVFVVCFQMRLQIFHAVGLGSRGSYTCILKKNVKDLRRKGNMSSWNSKKNLILKGVWPPFQLKFLSNILNWYVNVFLWRWHFAQLLIFLNIFFTYSYCICTWSLAFDQILPGTDFCVITLRRRYFTFPHELSIFFDGQELSRVHCLHFQI